MHKISVIIPVYGVEKYIERCARSLFEQTLDDLEFIFVDDCTPDRSVEILKSIIEEYQLRFAEKNYTARIERMPTNSGQAAARQQGYQFASGDYITFCDSDDLMPADAIETLYNLAVESGADIVSGDMEWLFEDGTTKRNNVSLPYGNDAESVYLALLYKTYSHNLCSKLFKSNLLKEYDYITLMNATNGEDAMLFYQVLQHSKKTVHINQVVYRYIQHSQSSTHKRFNRQALYSIVKANVISLNICRKFSSLQNKVWVCVSQSLNTLLANGYNDNEFKKIIRDEHLEDLINPCKMLQYYPINDFIKTMGRRILKPIIARFQ